MKMFTDTQMDISTEQSEDQHLETFFFFFLLWILTSIIECILQLFNVLYFLKKELKKKTSPIKNVKVYHIFQQCKSF